MSPRSMVARLTPSLVAGFDTYGFHSDGSFPELKRTLDANLPGKEFWVGGELVRALPKEERDAFLKAGVHLFDSPQQLLEEVGSVALDGSQ